MSDDDFVGDHRDFTGFWEVLVWYEDGVQTILCNMIG